MPDAAESDRSALRIVVPAGGIGGARFLRGLLAHLATASTSRPDAQVVPEGPAQVTVIGNTGDDIWIHGLRVCPDLDTVMYTLGGGISEERGWGREDETFTVKAELAEYGVEPSWFGLGDRDVATHLVRTRMLAAGYPLSQVTEALCTRWSPGVRLLPMSDDRAETHVVIADPDAPGGRRALHFQEWWIRHGAEIPALEFPLVGGEDARAAPGVLEAIQDATHILIPPSNPVVSIGTILRIGGIRDALRSASAPIVGVSPIIGGRPVRGMADACLAAIGVETTATAVGRHYGARRARIPLGAPADGLLDGWLVDVEDADAVAPLAALGIRCETRPLRMHDLASAADIAGAALALAGQLAREITGDPEGAVATDPQGARG